MNRNGFTLVELAVALLIVGLLLASALIPLSSQIEVRNVADTRRVMDQIREALVGFVQSNGRLPCPANGTLASGTATAGAELFSGTACTALVGVIPWGTLGVPETDAWGRRFTYRVSSVFSDAISQNSWSTSGQNGILPCTTPVPTPTLSSFATCSLGDIAVLTRSDANHANFTPIGTGLPAVFVSHGKNGYGAFQMTGTRVAGGTGDEAANANGGTGSVMPGSGNNYPSWAFYSRNPSPSAAGCSDTAGTLFCEFDDLVVMIPAPTLIVRMVSAGRLP